MKKVGRLIVLEGPDGVGKTTIALALNTYFRSQNIPTEYLAFPGKKQGTLGNLVYDIHHNLQRYGINKIAAASLQLLHISAHIDEIENRILPILNAGHHLILDRYWWSTWVYGMVSGVDAIALRKMIDIELSVWGAVQPSCAVLIDRQKPFRGDELVRHWKKIRSAYHRLLNQETNNYPVEIVRNDKRLNDAVQEVLEILDKHGIAYVTPKSLRGKRKPN